MNININNKTIKENESINILSLPFKSDYKVLVFTGLANGTALVPRFNFDSVLKNKKMVLKSFQIVPYYYKESHEQTTEAYNVTASEEFGVISDLNNSLRIQRIFDRYEYGTEILFEINGARIPIFQQVNDPNIDPALWVGYPLDLALDNIYYYYPANLQSLNISVECLISSVKTLAVQYNPQVKVVIECYLF